MATHTLVITVEVAGHNAPERPRAGHAFLNQIGHRIADGMLPRAIQQYVRDPGNSISLYDSKVADVNVNITIAETAGGGGGS